MGTASILASDFQQNEWNETSPWLCFCQGRDKSPKVSLEKDGVGICSELHSSPALCEVELKWSQTGSQREVSSQENPTSRFVSFPRAPWSRILGHSCAQQCHSPGWNFSPSSLPAQSWLCFVHHMPLFPGMKFPDPGSASLHLLLSRDTGCGHTETRTQHTGGRCRSALQGLTTFIFLGIWSEGSNQCSGTGFGRSTLAPSYQSL